MLGSSITDPHGIESDCEYGVGLGLLGVETAFGPEKRTTQLHARSAGRSFLSLGERETIAGYEIHMGRVTRAPGCEAAFVIADRNGRAEDALDGAVSPDGTVVGTMIHGLFENPALRRSLIAALRLKKGLPTASAAHTASAVAEDEFDRLADVLRESLDMKMLSGLIGR
jgi:adenosylcobyric acid synthase